MKDNFSKQADAYARYRPDYPQELFDFLLAHTRGRELAWDVGTGNGQVAIVLARYFQQVHATDISERQLSHAPTAPNLHYLHEPAERCSLPDLSCDLVVAAQAAHWFRLPEFYREVRRILRPGGLLALFGYGLLRTDIPELNDLIEHFYTNVTGPFWDPERRHIDAAYRSLEFPFEELPAPSMFIHRSWTILDIEAFLSTWSALQHCRAQTGFDPLLDMARKMSEICKPDEILPIEFPVFIKASHL